MCRLPGGFAPNQEGGAGGAGPEEGRSWIELDGAGFPKHLRSVVVFYFPGVLEWKFAFNPSLTS